MLGRYLLLASASLVAAQLDHATTTTEGTSSPTSTPSSDEPCAAVASLVSDSSSFDSGIPAQAAFDCLRSVPVDVDGNSKLIDELKVVWQWQSEIGWLKNTPQEWEFGPLDIDAELDNIQKNLASFPSEYDVQLAIQNITVRTGNFHFNYVPDILQVFRWQRQVDVVAIAPAGNSMPKLFAVNDAFSTGEGDISDIAQINGEDAFQYLEKISAWEQYIDPDGRLNSMLFKGDTQSPGSFAFQSLYDGPSTNFTFSNGTSASFDNLASTQQDFGGVTDGASFFETFCTGTVSGLTSDASIKTALDPKNNVGAPGYKPVIPHGDYLRRNVRRQIPSSIYPDAVVEAESGAVAGYFLKGDGFSDIAVLKIITFAPDNDNTGAEFQSTVEKFLSSCVESNKTNLIIDLRENGGGATHLLIDTFQQLFPGQEAFSAQRYRAQPRFDTIGAAVEEIHKNPDLNATYAQESDSTIDDDYRYWAYWHFRTAKGEDFKSFDDFNGPQTFNSDNFTTTMRYNYSNSDTVSIRPSRGFDFIDTSNTPPPFKAENVVMYTDALCGSSCASFHEELKNIAGVKAVTVGGRPENRTIQTVTGSKGGEVIPMYTFPMFASFMLNISAAFNLTSVSSTDESLTQLANVPQLETRAGDPRSRLQTQDQIRKGDTTGTPLQYIYEASDCKIFYTAETFSDPDAAWKQAWEAFGDDTKCIQGSTKHKSSISGGYKPYGPGELKDEDLPQSNGTATTNPSNGGGSGTQSGSPTPSKTGAGVRVGGSFGLVVSVVVAVVVGVL